jgi:hypothetical protein
MATRGTGSAPGRGSKVGRNKRKCEAYAARGTRERNRKVRAAREDRRQKRFSERRARTLELLATRRIGPDHKRVQQYHAWAERAWNRENSAPMYALNAARDEARRSKSSAKSAARAKLEMAARDLGMDLSGVSANA